MKLFNAFIIFIFFAVLWLVGCKRDLVDPVGEETELTQKEIEMKWAEAYSGRWFSYSIKKAYNHTGGEDIDTLQYMSSIYSVATNAQEYYKRLLFSKYTNDLPDDIDQYLDSIYPLIYGEMDKRMSESGYLENLYKSYKDLQIVLNKRKGKLEKLATNLPPVHVTRCGVPSILNDLSNRIATPASTSINNCKNYARIQIFYITNDLHNSTSTTDCRFLKQRAQWAMDEFMGCVYMTLSPEDYDDFVDMIPPPGWQPPTGGGSYPPNPTYTKPTKDQLKNQIKDKPFALFGDLDCDIVRKWVETARHQVQQAQIDKLNSVVNNIVHVSVSGTPVYKIQDIAHVQSIDNAYSAVVNMDYFPIRISKLPVVDGQRLTASKFKEYIRKNINSFVNTAFSKFEPYRWHGINDESLWNSENPLNTMIGIDIAGPDNGTVIVSKHNSTGWTFTTVYDPKYGIHPVSGNRDFGYVQNSDGSYTFYTRGVDRLTTGIDASMQNVAFFAADELWKSFQQKVKSFVDSRQGSSIIGTPDIKRPDWVKVKEVIDGKKPLSTLSTDCND